MRGYFIVCEGLDAAGKTTTIQKSIKYLEEGGFPIVYNKGLKSNNIFGKFSRHFPSTLSLLIETIYSDLSFVKKNIIKGKIIIQDRWFYSIFAHNPKNKKDKFLEKIFTPFLSKPDLFIYFSVSLEERIKRLEKTKENQDHRYLLENPSVIDEREKRFLYYFNESDAKKVLIDTTNKSENESGYMLYKSIHALLKPFFEKSR